MCIGAFISGERSYVRIHQTSKITIGDGCWHHFQAFANV